MAVKYRIVEYRDADDHFCIQFGGREKKWFPVPRHGDGTPFEGERLDDWVDQQYEANVKPGRQRSRTAHRTDGEAIVGTARTSKKAADGEGAGR